MKTTAARYSKGATVNSVGRPVLSHFVFGVQVTPNRFFLSHFSPSRSNVPQMRTDDRFGHASYRRGSTPTRLRVTSTFHFGVGNSIGTNTWHYTAMWRWPRVDNSRGRDVRRGQGKAGGFPSEQEWKRRMMVVSWGSREESERRVVSVVSG